MNLHVKQQDVSFLKKSCHLCEICLKEDISWPEAEKINVKLLPNLLSSKCNLAHGNNAVSMYFMCFHITLK